MKPITEEPLDPTNHNEIRIKLIPFKCVVCNGFGTLRFGKQICHACDGKGYILVDQNEQSRVDKTT